MARTAYQIDLDVLRATLFSITEGKDESLYFFIRSGKNHGTDDAQQVKLLRISAHYGNSPEYSTIKRHYDHTGLDKKQDDVALTTAIKGGGFVRIFSSLCPWMMSPSYIKSTDADIFVNLGSGPFLNGQLYYSVILSAAGAPLLLPENPKGPTVYNETIGRFNVCILLNWVGFPPTLHGIDMYIRTKPPELFSGNARVAMEMWMQGVDEGTIIYEHYDHLEVTTYSLLNNVLKLADLQPSLAYLDADFARPLLEERRAEALAFLEQENLMALVQR